MLWCFVGDQNSCYCFVSGQHSCYGVSQVVNTHGVCRWSILIVFVGGQYSQCLQVVNTHGVSQVVNTHIMVFRRWSTLMVFVGGQYSKCFVGGQYSCYGVSQVVNTHVLVFRRRSTLKLPHVFEYGVMLQKMRTYAVTQHHSQTLSLLHTVLRGILPPAESSTSLSSMLLIFHIQLMQYRQPLPTITGVKCDILRPFDIVCERTSVQIFFFLLVINHSCLSHRPQKKGLLIRSDDVV